MPTMPTDSPLIAELRAMVLAAVPKPSLPESRTYREVDR